MAGTLNYLYDPNQIVHVIVETPDPNSNTKMIKAVRQGRIIQVRMNLLVTDLTGLPVYDVQIERNPGTTEVEEADVFPSLAAAVAEYEIRIT